MTKVDMRTDFVNPIGGPFSQVVQAEKPIPRDTEAFKKLLQQLGCQSRQHHPGNEQNATFTISMLLFYSTVIGSFFMHIFNGKFKKAFNGTK